MTRKLIIAAALLMGTALTTAPALAQTAATCTPPPAPTPIDGSTATKDQMVAYHTALNSFMTTSDAYQKCLQDDIDAQTQAAKKTNTTFDNKADWAAAAANQKAKQDVADKYKGVLADYKKAQAAAK